MSLTSRSLTDRARTSRYGRTSRSLTSRRIGATVLLAASVIVTAACGSQQAGAPDPDTAAAVSADYQRYAKAVSAKDGETSADLVTADSLAYYDRVRDLALDADSAALAKEPVVDQLTVLTMRGEFDAKTLRTANPHDLVKAGVQKGLIGDGSMPQQGLQQIQIDGGTATAQLVLGGSDGAPSQYPISFQRDGDTWKFDVTALLKPAEQAMTQAADTQKLTLRKLVQQVMVARLGEAKAKTLYTPVGRA